MIDLHTHTTASDGSFTPKELIDYAIKKELTAIAITDHDTIKGLLEAKEYANSKNINLINGIEFSCRANKIKSDIHIVGLDFDIENPYLKENLKKLVDSRNQRNYKMISLINSLGYPLNKTEVKEFSGKSIITRSHLANILVKKGYFKNKDIVFKTFIGNGCKAYIPRENTDVSNIISLIKKSNGKSILAHPTLYKLSQKEIEELVIELKSYGLDGIEVFYSLHSTSQTAFIRSLAVKHNLILSGGSDFHGTNKKDIDLGTGLGHLNVPDELLENILSKNKTEL